MSSVNQLSVLAFAVGAMAVQHGHNHAHYHGHRVAHGSPSGYGSGAPFPYGSANSTGLWGTTGTGYGTGVAAPTGGYSAPASSASDVPTVWVSPIPAPSGSASAPDTYGNVASGSDSATECTTDVTVTTTERTYVTVTATYGDNSTDVTGPTQGSSSASKPQSTITVQSTVYYTPSSSVASPVESSTESSSSVESSSTEAAYTPSGPAAYTPQTASSAESTSSSSSEAAPVTTEASSSEAPSSAPAVSTTYSEVQKAPSWAPPAYSSAASSAWSTSSAVSSVVSSATSSAPAATSSASTPGSYTGKKRGVAYNDASLADALATSSNIGLAYNWGSSASGFDNSNVKYIPLLWGTADMFTSGWSDNAQAAIDSGSDVLFSFNEPDLSTQSNLSPEAAASAWKQYMEPFAGKAKLCSPAVTNGGGDMGLNWLENFLNACDGCTIDCVSIHWYASHSLGDYFKEQGTNATTVSGGKPVYVTEFGCTDGSDDDISDFLQDVMPWMDSNDDVHGYFYFMASDGLLLSGTSPSAYGQTYIDYTS